VTVVNGLNNDGIGDIIRFIADHIEKIHGVILQPVMFCGRDEDISADERYAKRYPVSQIAYDLQAQTSFGWEPMRDWFPVSAYGAFAQLCDILHPDAELGSLFNDIHPNHGMFSPILVNARTKEIVPVARFFNVEQFLKDIVEIADSARRPAITKSMVSLSLVRNFDSDNAPPDFGITQLRELLTDCVYRVAGSGSDWSERAYGYRGVWKLVMVSPMAFQDAHNYDLALISNSSTPVATQEGEINFCAYNGARWRRIVEHLHETATLSEWNRSHGRHPIYAKGKEVDLGAHGAPRTDLIQIERQKTTV
jgi:7,8-dihydro-6-hydroxymethylpterin dimethyltransferase